jgi:hypothetical protein
MQTLGRKMNWSHNTCQGNILNFDWERCVCVCMHAWEKDWNLSYTTAFIVLSTIWYFGRFLPALWCGYWIDMHPQKAVVSIMLVQVFHIVLSQTDAHVSDSFAAQSPQVLTSLWIQVSVIWPMRERVVLDFLQTSRTHSPVCLRISQPAIERRSSAFFSRVWSNHCNPLASCVPPTKTP